MVGPRRGPFEGVSRVGEVLTRTCGVGLGFFGCVYIRSGDLRVGNREGSIE